MRKLKKNIQTVNKFTNHLIFNGKKNKGEKILSQSVKALQTTSKKSSKKLVQLALLINTPIFKLNTIVQKKRKKKKARIIPAFIFNQASAQILIEKRADYSIDRCARLQIHHL